MPWHDERHLVVSVASDASAFAWGGVLLGDGGALLQEFGDAWCEPILSQPIHVKETVALSRTLLALSETVRNHRVDVCVDSRPLLDCWKRQYTRSHDMLEALKELFWITVRLNVALSLKYVPSRVNPADIPSRRLSVLDCSLSPRLWLIVQRNFGGPSGHPCDLMALDSNAQCDLHGYPLPHFAPVLTPNAMGVNVFAQSITAAGSSIFSRSYVFPPFALIPSLLRFLQEQRANCTIVVPDRYPRPYWWPIIMADCVQSLCLARKSDIDVLRRPTTKGCLDYGPIPWDLWAFRVTYTQ